MEVLERSWGPLGRLGGLLGLFWERGGGQLGDDLGDLGTDFSFFWVRVGPPGRHLESMLTKSQRRVLFKQMLILPRRGDLEIPPFDVLPHLPFLW